MRCDWAKNELAVDYHDNEWGVPLHDDRMLFEFLILEGAQAGLSWDTILAKRENYRKAFDNFDVLKVAKYGDKKFEQLLQNAGIVRNRLKIRSAVQNANAFLAVQKEFGTFDKYIWSFVGGKPLVNKFKKMGDVPAKTEISDQMSKDLKKRGFNFVGSTICYAFMQATGMVNDHVVSCFRFDELNQPKWNRRGSGLSLPVSQSAKTIINSQIVGNITHFSLSLIGQGRAPAPTIVGKIELFPIQGSTIYG
ncbi:MAG: DNA-3-methyladenine glycosylase I [Pyrinomonadaceae bacterium]